MGSLWNRVRARLWFWGITTRRAVAGAVFVVVLGAAVGRIAWRLRPVAPVAPRVQMLAPDEVGVVEAYTSNAKVQDCLASHPEVRPLDEGARAAVLVERDPLVSHNLRVWIDTRSPALQQCLRTAIRRVQPDVSGAYRVEVLLW